MFQALKLRTVVATVVALMGFTQCNVSKNSVEMQSVDMRGWTEPVTVTYHNIDTTTLRTISLALHVNRLYTEEQIEVEVCLMSPDSLRHTELIAVPTQAEWPNRTASKMDVEVPYRREVKMRCAGDYIVTITPNRSVQGIEAVGINFQSNK